MLSVDKKLENTIMVKKLLYKEIRNNLRLHLRLKALMQNLMITLIILCEIYSCYF